MAAHETAITATARLVGATSAPVPPFRTIGQRSLTTNCRRNAPAHHVMNSKWKKLRASNWIAGNPAK